LHIMIEIFNTSLFHIFFNNIRPSVLKGSKSVRPELFCKGQLTKVVTKGCSMHMGT
jgi:hypothetical protein